MELQPRPRAMGSVGITLGWLMWLLPGVGVGVLVLYVLREKCDMCRASAELLAQGRLGEAAAYALSVSIWAIGQLGELLVQNWPLVIGGATLALLVWALRSL